ncbi:MAG: hypothetical protein ACE5JR_04535 [Gemmatimonadota bacterium]
MPDTVRKVDYYTTTVADRPDEGARLLGVFREAGVNFLAVDAFPSGGGEWRVDLVPEDRDAFLAAAEKSGIGLSGAKAAFLLDGEDRVGATADTLGRLGTEGINVTAVTSIVTGGRYGTLLWVKPADMERAATTLGAK